MKRSARWRASIACAGVLAIGGIAYATPAMAASLNFSKTCGSTQQPTVTTQRGTNILGASTLHTWSQSGQPTRNYSGTAVNFASSYGGYSSGNLYASTAANSISVVSHGCMPKVT